MFPTPMSMFQSVSSISSETQFILVDKDGGGNPISAKASSSLVAPAIGSQRWILPAPTFASDPRGVDGSESYNLVGGTTLEYFIKFNGLWYKTTLTLVNPII